MPASVPPATVRAAPQILDAALQLFAEQGYHGTSIREIARGAGLSVPGVYHHYASKQEVLVALMLDVMDALLARTRAVMAASASAAPVERFDAVVGELLRFHVERRAEAFVASTELRSLDPENRARIVALRDEQQQMVEECVAAGCGAGDFTTSRPHEAARAVAVLCVGVASWYRPGGDPVDVLVQGQLELCRALVGAG